MAIGDEIRRLRFEKGLTQGQLAEMIGVTPAAIGNYECSVSFPKQEKLMALFTALDCTPNELLGEGYVDKDVLAHSRDYAKLDEVGRRRVDRLTEQELERCGLNDDSGDVRIAAREGNPNKSELTPKRGKNILEAPDYRGKG